MSAESLMKLRHSGLFDERYYNTQLKSARFGEAALEHFLLYSAVQRLDPHPLFCTDYYLRHNPDVKNAGVNPLLHYIEHGAVELREVHPLFNSNFYLDQFRESEKPNSHLLMHYLAIGGFEGKNPHPLFDSAYYIRQNHLEQVNPLVHFLTHGAAAGCKPHPFFDTAFYASQLLNSHQESMEINPLVHFVLQGAREGLSPHPKIAARDVRQFFCGDTASHADFVYFFSAVERNELGDELESVSKLFTAPSFLSDPSADDALEVIFSEPTLNQVVSQLCTANQLEESEYFLWCKELVSAPNKNRKLWEFVFILAALEQNGMLLAGKTGIGFGTGQEPLPSLFASNAIDVLATDAPEGCADVWSATLQRADSLETLWNEKIVEHAKFKRHVSHALVDMNSIPPELTGYDFCWSACALEHLGSIEKGLQFIENSLECVKPGGLIVHTTEFNLDSNEETVEVPSLCLFRRKDIERLLRKLALAGHEVFPLNLCTGNEKLDLCIDLPPFSLPHLKLQVCGFTTTSLGLIVRKAR